MKSLKFMLLSAFVMLGTSAFAGDPEFKKDNIGFLKTGTESGKDAKNAISVQVVCAYAEDGLTIPDAFTKVDALEKTVYYKVTSFLDGWENNVNAYDDAKAVAGKLKTLTISSKNVTDLTQALDGLTVLESLTISSAPDAWTDIAPVTGKIADKSKIKTLDLGALGKVTDGMTTALSKANGWTALATLTLPANVTKLPASFLEETPVATLNNLGKVTNIGASALKKTKIAAIDLSKVTDLGDNALEGTAITELTIPAKLANIGSAAFKDMKALATLTINRNATNKNVPAVFAGCTAVKELTLVAAESVDAGAFADMPISIIDLRKCPKLAVALGDFKAGQALSEVLLANSLTDISAIDLSASKFTLKKVSFSALDGVTKVIPLNTFKGFTKLKGISIPAEYNVGDNAFDGCTALASVIIGEDVTVGANAFDGCTALETLTIGEDATIGYAAFNGCKALATITWGNADTDLSFIQIGDAAFQDCIALTEISLPDNVAFSGTGDDIFKGCALLKKFIAGRGITFIPAAFDGCNSLKTVVIPGSVVSISPAAFKGLTKLANVLFDYDTETPDVLFTIGASAFEGCTALTAIDLSKTALTVLDQVNVFKGCSALATVTLPEEMGELSGASIFEGTAIEKLNATMVGFKPDLGTSGIVGNIFGSNKNNPNAKLKTLLLGNADIQANAFAYCTKLKTLIVDNYAYDHDGDPATDDLIVGPTINNGAFAYCNSLATVTLGQAAVNGNAFAYCENLATVTIEPSKNTWVSQNAFDHCTALTTFNYSPAEPDAATFGWISPKAFTYCTPYVTFNTTKEFANVYTAKNGGAPLNTAWTADVVDAIVKTVQDKANPNQFVAKFWSPVYNVAFSADDVKLYTVYVDGEDAYFSACRADGGKYYVYAGTHVILKTTEEKEVPYEVNPAMGKNAKAFDDIASLPNDGELGDLQAVLNIKPGQYIYRLTNTADQGFGFTAYTGTTIKANQFFIASDKKPASGRLNTVWLDEDGNIEGEATAINKIESVDANDGAIYNMQGVRVEKAQKGIYIQNGKKIVVK